MKKCHTPVFCHASHRQDQSFARPTDCSFLSLAIRSFHPCNCSFLEQPILIHPSIRASCNCSFLEQPILIQSIDSSCGTSLIRIHKTLSDFFRLPAARRAYYHNNRGHSAVQFKTNATKNVHMENYNFWSHPNTRRPAGRPAARLMALPLLLLLLAITRNQNTEKPRVASLRINRQ
jgi:hypothetical protein